MATSIPSIACIGIIGRNNNPLHTQILPSHSPTTHAPIRSPLQFSLLLSSTIDVFDMRAKAQPAVTGDLGLLHAIDERLAAYGFETNTGVRFVVVVDVRGGRAGGAGVEGRKGAVGLREGDLKPVFKALQSAYIALLQNPFYEPDEHAPPTGRGGKKITSRKFADEVRRIGETWVPGMTSI